MTTKHLKKASGRGERSRRRRRAPRPPQPVNMGVHSGPLRLAAFSDYRVQDIELLIEKLSRLQPRPDLILYAGDDIVRFRPSGGKNLFEAIASCAHYGLCAVAGNDDEPALRTLISGRSVFNVHLSPAVLGQYAVLGIDGAPRRRGIGVGPNLHSEKQIASHLAAQMRATMAKKAIILSHAPPEGLLDQEVRFSVDGRPHSIGSQAIRNFLGTHKNVSLVVCGHVHLCGGQHARAGRAVIVNAANHDDEKAVDRFAIVTLHPSGRSEVEWRLIRETRALPGIGLSIAGRLRERDVRTLEELASASPEAVYPVLRSMGYNPQVICSRARAVVENRPVPIAKPQFPQRPRVFLDVETDVSASYVWLIGCLVDERDYTGFFAESPADEKRILKEFLRLISQHPSATILSFSGSRFDERILRQRLSFHCLDTSACARMVDVYWLIERAVALPTESMRLKELATFFGYRRKHPDLDGYEIASQYEDRYQRVRSLVARRRLARRFLDYNEDDVRCLPHILDAIQALGRNPVND